MSNSQRLEDLLAAGEVESAVFFKGDFTPDQLDTIRRIYEAGIKHGKQLATKRDGGNPSSFEGDGAGTPPAVSSQATKREGEE